MRTHDMHRRDLIKALGGIAFGGALLASKLLSGRSDRHSSRKHAPSDAILNARRHPIA
ncbi:MAG TPA: hypothetical protein VEU47_00170 [Candidatus Cybelea sp.]|nr:hypothetical protein [Candidatus Cybelea sp.]